MTDADCTMTMLRAQSFLHGELSEAEADEIREHLMTCGACLDFYDCETLIATMVRRCCQYGHQLASAELRMRVTSLHVELF